jgi:hypothetical protein
VRGEKRCGRFEKNMVDCYRGVLNGTRTAPCPVQAGAIAQARTQRRRSSKPPPRLNGRSNPSPPATRAWLPGYSPKNSTIVRKQRAQEDFDERQSGRLV